MTQTEGDKVSESVVLTFDGTDTRDLIETLIEAVRLTRERGERPSIRVAGKIYPPDRIAKVAELLPNEELSDRHRAIISQMFRKRQRDYRQTAHSLANRASQIASAARFSAVMSREYAKRRWQPRLFVNK
jgi:hypothetical protein